MLDRVCGMHGVSIAAAPEGCDGRFRLGLASRTIPVGPMDTHEYERLAEYEEWYWWHRARQTIVQTLLRRYAPRGARILDVGCGTGATTQSLSEFGQVVGLDVGMDALRFAHRRGVPVAGSVAAPLAVRSNAVDVIVALDVLEHLPDDRGAACEMLRVLAPRGRVARHSAGLSVPMEQSRRRARPSTSVSPAPAGGCAAGQWVRGGTLFLRHGVGLSDSRCRAAG